MGVQFGTRIPRKDISFEDLAGKKIAIDFSNAIYQFLASIRQRDGTPLMDSKGRITSHLMGIFTRTINLLEKGLKPCYVFDGEPPEIKRKTIEERREHKLKAAEKYHEASELGLIGEMLKFAKQALHTREEMFEESKQLILALGVPVVQAPSEAEAQAAFMCENDDVYAVGSQDYDSLLFGAKRLVQNLTLSEKRKLPSGGFVYIKPELIELQEVLEELNIDHDQLIVMAILIGTDYNPGGVKGIGPKKALELVRKEKNPEVIFKHLNPDFDWHEIFETFKRIPIKKDYKLEWHDVDEEKVKKLLVDEHDFSEERVNNILAKLKKAKEQRKQASLSSFF